MKKSCWKSYRSLPVASKLQDLNTARNDFRCAFARYSVVPKKYWEIPLLDWFGSNACNKFVSNVLLEKDLANPWIHELIRRLRQVGVYIHICTPSSPWHWKVNKTMTFGNLPNLGSFRRWKVQLCKSLKCLINSPLHEPPRVSNS